MNANLSQLDVMISNALRAKTGKEDENFEDLKMKILLKTCYPTSLHIISHPLFVVSSFVE